MTTHAAAPCLGGSMDAFPTNHADSRRFTCLWASTRRTSAMNMVSGDSVPSAGSALGEPRHKRTQEGAKRLRQRETGLTHMNRLSMMGELATSLAHELTQAIASAPNNARAALNFWARPDLPVHHRQPWGRCRPRQTTLAAWYSVHPARCLTYCRRSDGGSHGDLYCAAIQRRYRIVLP
jgi:hypothetical protein